MINKIIKKVIFGLMYPYRFLITKLHNISMLDDLFKSISNGKEYYYYGVINQAINKDNSIQYNLSQIAIVLQGQIKYEDSFTEKTIRNYRFLYPNTPIIVSTWKGEVTNSFHKICEELNVIIIENEYPDSQGFWHVNYQIRSSLSGIEYAKQNLNVQYIFKTRTDQRFYKRDFLQYLYNLHRIYNKPNENRIIFLNSTYMYIPFYVCDYISFGFLNDIYNLYNIPYENGECDSFSSHLQENRKLITKERDIEYLGMEEFNSRVKENLFQNIKGLCVPEMYIAFSYYKKYINHKACLEDINIYDSYFKFIKSNMIIVDERDLYMYWPKYQYRAYRDINYDMYHFGLDHARWLDIFINQ